MKVKEYRNVALEVVRKDVNVFFHVGMVLF